MSPAKKPRARKAKDAGDYTDTTPMVVGLGGTGYHDVPECPVCYAHGGGGHGGGCPNAAIELPGEWVAEPPDGWSRPERPL